jgi:hypothetical protein
MDAMQPLLADLANAQRALRRSSSAFDDAIAGIGATVTAGSAEDTSAAIARLRETVAAIATANQAHGAAIDAVIAATDKALAFIAADTRH